MKANDILSFWQTRNLPLAPHEGFCFGSPEVELAGVLVCWMPTAPAIRAARDLGCNLILAHEHFGFPPKYSGARLDQNLSDRINLPRIRELAERDITVLWAADSLDEVILDGFAQALGLPDPQVCRYSLQRIYHVPALPARQMAVQVMERMAVASLRVCGNLERMVRRVALLPGNSASAHNPEGLRSALAMAPDLLIAGDTDEYPMRAAIDADVPMILVGHARSLAPGLSRFATALRGAFPTLCVECYENPRPWATV